MSFGPTLPPEMASPTKKPSGPKVFPLLPDSKQLSAESESDESDYGPVLPGEDQKCSSKKDRKRTHEDTGDGEKSKKKKSKHKKKHKKSLLELHAEERKKAKAEKPDLEKPTRKPFDPSTDMAGDAVKLVSASARRNIVSKAQTGLTSRFASSSRR